MCFKFPDNIMEPPPARLKERHGTLPPSLRARAVGGTARHAQDGNEEGFRG